jgi:hypothetical protein
VPLRRALVESSDGLALPSASGFSRVVSGGQACAQAPEQRLAAVVSLRNR